MQSDILYSDEDNAHAYSIPFTNARRRRESHMAIQISTNPGRCRSSIDEIDLRASRLVTMTLKMDSVQDWYWSWQNKECFFFMSLWNSSVYRRRLHLHRLPRYTEELYNPTSLTSHISGQDHPTARLLCCKVDHKIMFHLGATWLFRSPRIQVAEAASMRSI